MNLNSLNFQSERFRKPLLYPAELRGHKGRIYAIWNTKARRFCLIVTQNNRESSSETLGVSENKRKVFRSISVDNSVSRATNSAPIISLKLQQTQQDQGQAMARINIEDDLWSDPRFMRLCILLGDEARAVGAVVLGWRTAQKYWCPDRKPIPRQVFIDAMLSNELVTSGLAVVVDDDIRMRGSEEHFDWWFQKQEAGRKGGIASAAKRALSGAKRDSSKSKRIEPSSSSSSSSSSFKNSVRGKKSKLTLARPPSATDPAVKDVIGEFYAAWKERYKNRPPLMPADHKALKSLTESLGADAAKELIRRFLKMDDKWFKEKRHDVSTLMSNLPKIQANETKAAANFVVPD